MGQCEWAVSTEMMHANIVCPSTAFRAAVYLTVLIQMCCGSSQDSKVNPCQGENFKCESADCVPLYFICDGSKDCPDGSDETELLCKHRNISCPPTAFQCHYGACIDNKKKCNGIADCADGSDETATECSFEQNTTQIVTELPSLCKDDQFMCISSQCIDEFSVCDGIQDCDDGSDETKKQCSTMTCPPTAFSCLYGGCVEVSAQCNGHKDCIDNSDEDLVLCKNLIGNTIPPTNLPSKQCPPTAFSCTYGGCIEASGKCNGYMDCIDNSDEDPVLCGIKTENTRGPPSGGCMLPPPPEFSNYISPLCSSNNVSSACRNIPGTQVDQPWLLLIHCKNGYYFKETENDFYTLCNNGNWSPQIPKCRKMCPSLTSLSVDVKCVYKENVIDCNKPMRPGTRASGHCKPLYTHTKSLSTEIICQENGNWNDNLFFCDPVCGKRNVYEDDTKEYFLNHGLIAQHGEFPWHVGIYVKDSTDQWRDQWRLTCGGSLISPHIVLTAARCLHQKHPTEIKVGLGKYHRDWTCNEVDAVKSDVKEIQIPHQFSGHGTSFEYDIALLDLAYSVQINMYIMPVCVDWSHEYTITTGVNGTLVGWGESDKLLYAEMPYLSNSECSYEKSQVMQRFITRDKFCARGSCEDSNAVSQTRGGGLTFVHNDLSYVYGVVSSRIITACTYNRTKQHVLVTFTNVTDSDLFSWLSSIKKKYDEVHFEK